MHSPFSSHFLRYPLSIFLISDTTATFFNLREVLDTSLVALLFLLPVGLSTFFWGLGPGITSAFFSFLTFNFFFIQPYYTLTVHQPIDLVILFVFLIVADAGFVHVVIARHRPQSNGIAERFVRTIKEWLADKVWSSDQELRELLNLFLPEYNNRPHQGLPGPGLSPNEFANRLWLM